MPLDIRYVLSEQENPTLDSLIRQSVPVRNVPIKETFEINRESSDMVYYILEGRVRHYLLRDDGAEKLLCILTKGWFFGEKAAFLVPAVQGNYITETPCEIACLPGGIFTKFMQKNPQFFQTVFSGMCQKQELLMQEIEDLTFKSSQQRLRELLCSLADTSELVDSEWYRTTNVYTHYEMGTIIGVTRIMVSKLMVDFSKAGKIRIVNRKIQIHKDFFVM